MQSTVLARNDLSFPAKRVDVGVRGTLHEPLPNSASQLHLCLQSATQHSGERIYKAVEDEEFDGPLRVFPAFTRRREHTVGRLAMLGCAAAWAGEVSPAVVCRALRNSIADAVAAVLEYERKVAGCGWVAAAVSCASVLAISQGKVLREARKTASTACP